ncbi:MAG: hypothetical protein RLP09_36365 [Sandaracinaceae bacterium]
MIVFHVFQGLFLAGVLALVVERVRTLAFRSALDAGAFRRALVQLLRAGEHERAAALTRDALPAWVAECVWPLLDPERQGDDRVIDLEDAMMDVQGRAARGMRGLRISASIGSALGFLGAALSIGWIFIGDHGLMRLQAGLVENIGLGRAVISIAIGISTSSLALGSWTVLTKIAKARLAESRRVVASVEEALGQEPAADRGSGGPKVGVKDPVPPTDDPVDDHIDDHTEHDLADEARDASDDASRLDPSA